MRRGALAGEVTGFDASRCARPRRQVGFAIRSDDIARAVQDAESILCAGGRLTTSPLIAPHLAGAIPSDVGWSRAVNP